MVKDEDMREYLCGTSDVGCVLVVSLAGVCRKGEGIGIHHRALKRRSWWWTLKTYWRFLCECL